MPSKKFIFLFILCSLLLISCGGKKKEKHIPFYSPETFSESLSLEVPFKLENGVRYIPVQVNGVNMDMIIDIGCSQTLISILEAAQLAKRGLLTEDDYLGSGQCMVADGSVAVDEFFNIRSIKITDGTDTIECKDVPVQVADNPMAPVLLGNAVLDDVASFTIDNDAQVIRFTRK